MGRVPSVRQAETSGRLRILGWGISGSCISMPLKLNHCPGSVALDFDARARLASGARRSRFRNASRREPQELRAQSQQVAIVRSVLESSLQSRLQYRLHTLTLDTTRISTTEEAKSYFRQAARLARARA
jgi:hypothetical protein